MEQVIKSVIQINWVNNLQRIIGLNTKPSYLNILLSCTCLASYNVFILTSGIPSVDRIDLEALTLVGPTAIRQVLDPLSCIKPRQSTINNVLHYLCILLHSYLSENPF